MFEMYYWGIFGGVIIFVFLVSLLFNHLGGKMYCIKCKHSWKRSNIKEYISLMGKCPKCNSRIGIIRNDFILSIYKLFVK